MQSNLKHAYDKLCTVNISIVIPCLNEEKTIGYVLEEIVEVMYETNYSFEVIVADNGSTDRSIDIAKQFGCRVILVPDRGYGSALDAGIRAALGDYVVMLDADFTYDSHGIPIMVDRIEKTGAQIVIGSRLRGTIEVGAMPFLHRYLGTPVLTALINWLLGGNISDCNSGMRIFKKSAYLEWDLTSPGMEFASEMIVACMLRGDYMEDVPINFRKDLRDRPPHLRTWNDGMRHLLFILSRAPRFFVRIGSGIVVITALLAFLSFFGPFYIGRVGILGYHTLIFAIIFGFFGAQIFMHGVTLDIDKGTSQLARKLLAVKESTLFFSILGSFVLIVALLVGLLFSWSRHGFHELSYLTPSLIVVYIIAVVGSVTIGLFHAHMLKRVERHFRRTHLVLTHAKRSVIDSGSSDGIIR